MDRWLRSPDRLLPIVNRAREKTRRCKDLAGLWFFVLLGQTPGRCLHISVIYSRSGVVRLCAIIRYFQFLSAGPVARTIASFVGSSPSHWSEAEESAVHSRHPLSLHLLLVRRKRKERACIQSCSSLIIDITTIDNRLRAESGFQKIGVRVHCRSFCSVRFCSATKAVGLLV